MLTLGDVLAKNQCWVRTCGEDAFLLLGATNRSTKKLRDGRGHLALDGRIFRDNPLGWRTLGMMNLSWFGGKIFWKMVTHVHHNSIKIWCCEN